MTVPLEWEEFGQPGFARRAIRDSQPCIAQVKAPSGVIYISEAPTWGTAAMQAFQLAISNGEKT